jgi:dipeptidyl aminopeptidase/acylaminoacyl peptidase
MEAQQKELFEYVRETERLEKERKEREKAERGPRVDPYYLKETERVSDLSLAPDGQFVTFILADRRPAEKAKVVDMPEYVTESGFVEMRKLVRGSGYRRVKAGEPVVAYRLGVLKLADSSIQFVDHGRGDRDVNFNAPVWSDDGSKAVAWAGAVDHKDAWLLLLNLEDGTSRVVVHEHDDAWVRGFRTGRSGRGDGLAYGFMPDDASIYFLSERDGFFHLYVTGLEDGQPRQLTQGNFELTDLRMSEDKTKWYFISNEVHPGEHHLYTMPIQGGEQTRLTKKAGWYGYVLSPDEKYVALTYSTATMPADLFVMANRPGASTEQLTESTTEEFRRHPWRASEIVTFEDGEGHTIYADLWKPEKPHPSRPAIIRVHGAGWSQGVYRRWSSMNPFYHYLLQEGYTVLNVDYRGSRGYGRDFRTAIYRHMGETEIKSALAAVEYLVEHCDVDRERIGLFGGSYGGFFTLMALFKYPSVFKAGAVRAPVTDWAHYNHGYTTRILNNPYDDNEAYERSSPIHLAEGFQDHLLIQHGIEDDNVHFQDSVRLAQRLLELRKDNWEIMLYPVEAHGLRNEDYNRLDVMRRRVKLFNRVLK